MKNLESKNKIFYIIKYNLIFFLKCITSILFILLFFFNLYNNNKYINYEKISELSKKNIKTNKKFISILNDFLKNEQILVDENMNAHTTFKLGGPAKIFVKPKTVSQLIEIIQLCNKLKIYYFIMGNGSNLLVGDKGYYGVIIQIRENNFSELKVIKEDDNNYLLIAGGGMLMKTLSIEACLLSLTGLEDIIDIPGTIGGGIIMNASFKRTGLRKPLIKVKVLTPEGKIEELTNEECEFYHRGSKLKDQKYIVIEATFKLKKGNQMIIQKTMTNNTKMRYEKQPMYFGSAGCFFIWNNTKYGSMHKKYEKSNLINYKVGDIMVYTYNIAFIVNLGKGTPSQVMEIVTHIESKLKEKYNIDLKREVIVIGSFNKFEKY